MRVRHRLAPLTLDGLTLGGLTLGGLAAACLLLGQPCVAEAQATSTAEPPAAPSRPADSERPPEDTDELARPLPEGMQEIIPAELQHRLTLSLLAFVPESDTRFDGAIGARSYGDSDTGFGGEAGFLRRAGDSVFWFGGQFGVRARHWPHFDLPPAAAVGYDLLALLQLRVAARRVFEFGAGVGAGAGMISLGLNGHTERYAAWRLRADATFAFRLTGRVRAFARFGYDAYRANVGGGAGDLDLGGGLISAGVEILE